MNDRDQGRSDAMPGMERTAPERTASIHTFRAEAR